MKKICHITTVHSALDVRIFYKEARSLAKAGYSVSVVGPFKEDQMFENIRIIALPEGNNRLSRMFSLTRKAYDISLKEKAFLYHFHDPELIPVMLRLKKKMKAKVIYDVHENVSQDIETKEWIPRRLRRLIALMFDHYEAMACKKFDCVVAATPSIKEKYKRWFSVDVRNYPLLENIGNQPGFSAHPRGKSFRLIYAGGLERNRGIRETVEALQYLNSNSGIKLTLLGTFSEKKFEEEIKKINNSDQIDYRGWVSPDKVFGYLKEADCGIVCLHPVASFLTSLPIKMFEYMQAGLPVVASDFPYWKKIIEENHCGICVDPLDPQDIARAIEYIIKNPKEAEEMGKRGYELVKKSLNWENEEKKLLAVYKKLCAE